MKPTPLLTLRGHTTSLAGGLDVQRLLPAAAQRSVGPFVFFDHFGPVTLPAALDSDVGGHPHIGLATVSYLFEGSLMHRDSLGTVQAINPGAINWMSAGRGIVHSERTPDDQRGRERGLHGLQLWVALPPALEESEPSFQHVPASALPMLAPCSGVSVRVLVGAAFGAESPVRTASPTLYLDVQLDPGASFTLPPLADERALYAPAGQLVIDGETFDPFAMVVLPPGREVVVSGVERFVVIGGAALPQPVRMWWNFVASDRAKLAAATARWAAGGFDPIPGETDRIEAPPWRD